MSFLIAMLLPLLACVLLMAGTAAFWWRTLRAPWLFLVVGFLALLGTCSVVRAGAELVRVLRGSGYFLEYRDAPSAALLAQESLTMGAVVTSALIVAFGLPLLLWLKRALLATSRF